MATTKRGRWLRTTADALGAGKFDYATVTEPWQRKALEAATPTDGCELHEAYPEKLLEEADEADKMLEAHWDAGEEIYVAWIGIHSIYSEDGDSWVDGMCEPELRPEFEDATIVLCGGPRDGEMVS